MPAIEELRARLRDYHALNKVGEVLEWDQQVCMPRGGAAARAEHTALVRRLVHEHFVADETGRLLDACEKAGLGRGAESADDALVRWARREYAVKRRQPTALVERLARETSRGQEIWAEARAKDDYSLFLPALETIVGLRRELAAAAAPAGDPYDAWLEEYEPGMSTAELDALFSGLKAGLVPLVRRCAELSHRVDDAALRGRFSVPAQRALCALAARTIGYDFDRGRQDEAVHPFSLALSPGDARITARYQEDFLAPGLFGTLHEAGHAMYEQGVPASLEGTPLCGGATMGLHESQSRLWENVVGRGRAFWRHFFPKVAEAFPEAMRGRDAETLYRAVNKAGPSLIRVEADELTYSLHVLLRFELERALLSGAVAPKDLPEAWNAKMTAYIGLTPPTYAQGVLQDVHWSAGLFGYFPTYALGNMIAAQLYAAALRARPQIPAAIERGDCSPLLGWLRENVHAHGRKFSAPELVRRATGEAISPEPYLRYLRAKFGELYGF